MRRCSGLLTDPGIRSDSNLLGVPRRHITQWVWTLSSSRTRGSARIKGGEQNISTATTTGSIPARRRWIPSSLYRMTGEKYESLIASDCFGKRDDVHLINGDLVNRMAESPLHGAVGEAIRLAIEAILSAAWHIRSEKGLCIPSQISVPRPDIAVVRGTPRDDLARYPEPADTALGRRGV